jgi:hypothetical protein
MSKDSISDKLSELFDLYKSEALTKEEYELLKSQLMSDNGIQLSPIAPKVATLAQTEETQTAQTNNEPLENEENSIALGKEESELSESKLESDEEKQPNINQQEIKTSELNDESSNSNSVLEPISIDNIPVNKNKRSLTIPIWIVAILLIISAVIIKTYIADDKQTIGNDKSIETPVSSIIENEIPVNVPEVKLPERIDNYITWDEAKASEIVNNELYAYDKWTEMNPNIKKEYANHKIIGFQKVGLNNVDYMIAITYTGSDLIQNISQYDFVLLSLFEFKFDNGWILNWKSFGFGNGSHNSEGTVDFTITQIAADKYGTIIKNNSSNQGYFIESTNLYTHVDDSLNCVLSFTSANTNTATVDGKEDYMAFLSIPRVGDTFYPIELIEKGIKNDGTKIDNKIIYKFDGHQYINTSGIEPYGHSTYDDYSNEKISNTYNSTSENNKQVIQKADISKNLTPDQNIDILKQNFLKGENQHPYSSYSKHEFTLNNNAPKVDKKRGLEPKKIANGIQRAYFENSNNICLQRTIQNQQVVEEIQFHPDGRIYSITQLRNGKKQGKVKYVDLDDTVILEGEFDQGNFVGMWNSPVLGNFNPNSNIIQEQYPSIINQIRTLIHFYDYDKDERQFYMN